MPTNEPRPLQSNLEMNTDLKIAEALPLFSFLLGVIGVFLWQIKRWSDGKPFVDFFVAGGETPGGQTFGFKVTNRGQVPAYKLALSVTWHDGPVWATSALPGEKQLYVEVDLSARVQDREMNSLKAWLDFYDQYGRQFRISRDLAQRWNTQHHKFFIDQASSDLVVARPNWVRDIWRWKKVRP